MLTLEVTPTTRSRDPGRKGSQFVNQTGVHFIEFDAPRMKA